MDFSEAFDTVPHHRLISKLDYFHVSSGVPQGTVLGPLMFLLYINYISADCISTIRLFADDTILYSVLNQHWMQNGCSLTFT